MFPPANYELEPKRTPILLSHNDYLIKITLLENSYIEISSFYI